MDITLHGKKPIRIRRDANGVPCIRAGNYIDLNRGIGYAHAMDRPVQMLLMRILGKGRAAELLEPSDQMAAIDRFFRRMDWKGSQVKEIQKLSMDELDLCQAYCEGVNQRLAEKKPWEMKLLGYTPEPWTVGDCMLLARMTGYLTLVQAQSEMELFIIQMAQNGVERERLEELFPGLLEGLDIDLLRKVTVTEPVIPPAVKWSSLAAAPTASNNWAVSGGKTVSGKPLLSSDPHLETNRLPNVWYELSLQCGNRSGAGVNMPGMPGLVIGRTDRLAWGATYSFMDAADFWIERCEKGKYLRMEEGREVWKPFTKRHETIKRKRKEPLEITYYENENGTLYGDPFESGYYLTHRWSSARAGARSMKAIFDIWHADNVKEGMDALGRMEISFNWVMADEGGNIGYQMSGLMPKRREGVSGLIPLPGWEPGNTWQGMADFKDLPRSYNPESGIIVTANNDLNRYGIERPISVCMADYRARRIAQLLEQGDGFTAQDMGRIQRDIYSLQAETFMEILRPLLPPTPNGDLLKNWDLSYDTGSKGAYLFEEFYRELFLLVFGENGIGRAVMEYAWQESGAAVDFYGNFDAVLLSETSRWLNGHSRDELFRMAALRALERKPVAWGEHKKFTLRNILLGEKLPGLFGFNYGPVKMRGGRATVQQGQLYRSGGRESTFCPSFRLVTDLAERCVYTNMAGGPSDRRFSKWYASDMKNWLNGRYKTVSLPGRKGTEADGGEK